MYIKFCRSYGEDKKDEANANLSPESKLSVELEKTGEKGRLEQLFFSIDCGLCCAHKNISLTSG